MQSDALKIYLENWLFDKILNHQHKLLEVYDTELETGTKNQGYKFFEDLSE